MAKELNYADTIALALEAVRAAGVRAETEPASDETAATPVVFLQDAGPVNVRNGPEGAGTNTVINLSAVAQNKFECRKAIDKAVFALTRPGQYSTGRLVRGRAVNLPRPVGQIVLVGDNLFQWHAMVKIIVRNTLP